MRALTIKSQGKWLVFCITFLIAHLTSAQDDPILAKYKSDLPGYYVFTGMSFSQPTDLNRDGKIGLTYAQEMDKCARDQQYEFNEDGTGKMYWGQLEKDCKRKGEEEFKWKIRAKTVASDNDVGRKYYLIMGDEFDGTAFEIVDFIPGIINLKGEFPDGIDSTYEGEMQLRKRKKKTK